MHHTERSWFTHILPTSISCTVQRRVRDDAKGGLCHGKNYTIARNKYDDGSVTKLEGDYSACVCAPSVATTTNGALMRSSRC